jgi:hypothetical protein
MPKAKPKASSKPAAPATELIDEYLADLTDWRGTTLAKIRELFHAADPEVVEEWKWMGSPVWSHDGQIAVANAHKDKVKVTFARGAHLPDPRKVFNAGLDGNLWRAIDLYEGDELDEAAFEQLVRAAVAHNASRRKK